MNNGAVEIVAVIVGVLLVIALLMWILGRRG